MTFLGNQGKALIIVAVDGLVSGIIGFSDELRVESKDMLSRISGMNIRSVLLTGDNANAAGYMASRLGLSEVCSDLLPANKVDAISSLQKEGHIVAMIGDGVNDAPALKTADVGIAMGKLGNDITVDAADIALIDNNLMALPKLKSLSIATLTTIKQNLTFSLLFNLLCIGLSVLGVIGPFAGAILHNVSSLIVIFNASRLCYK